MMRQYREIKDQHTDAVLFFRLGDFYEMFFDDAVEGSQLLGLTLTKRQDTPMCGVPFHAADSYIGRLTKLGKKVAICDQVSDPTLPGIVERKVIRIVTPGTVFDDKNLDQKSNHFIISVCFDGDAIGLAAVDATTGTFHLFNPANLSELKDEITRINPAECVLDAVTNRDQHGNGGLPEFLQNFTELPVFPHKLWDVPEELIKKQFAVSSLTGFGLPNEPVSLSAAALIISYLRETQKSELGHLNPPKFIRKSDELILDETAIRNLELTANLREQTREGSLFSVIDKTRTSMGGRMLKSWLLHPLHNKSAIEDRLDSVCEIIENFELKSGVEDQLAGILDMERLLGRLSIGTGNARDVLGIGLSLRAINPIKELLKKSQSNYLQSIKNQLENLEPLLSLCDKILSTILDAPPLSIKEGGLIRDGISAELDELRALSREGKNIIQKMQADEIARTGISSLKIRYNSVFGYYIEITKANTDKVPQNYIRKQTLVNAERYITPELKEYEEKILGAEEKINKLEYEIFDALRANVTVHTRDIQAFAQACAVLDSLHSLAGVAQQHRYVRPQILDEGGELAIKNGRHPVVEQMTGGKFIPNDLALGSDTPSPIARLLLITGPNMGGKSTYLRQTALICLLAHIGSFVPAESAQIPLVDRIFTRVGASDNLVRGQSTFMVEMQETAQILHYATKNSLIILDEIGRGTSTYDGVSLAWAILEYIHNEVGAYTLFATHYHELIPVADKLDRAGNVSVAVTEEKGQVVFLYRVLPGAIDRSYGIEVARLAGLPIQVVEKSKTILEELEKGVLDSAVLARAIKDSRNENQINMFANDTNAIRAEVTQNPVREHRVIKELNATDVDSLTPLEALKKLDEWKKLS